ncbi:MAG TPA: DUF2085 domain-containing protein [Patescibacteria group bacterium]|nr:DUF2085 domain-containing protein [Patescibacteria group bacterium]
MNWNRSFRPMTARLVLAMAAATWCAAIVAPPLMHAVGLHAPAIVLRAMFAPLCHQMTTRSFLIGGEPMAVCARCTGACAGFLLGSLGLVVCAGADRNRNGHGHRVPSAALLVLAALPSALDVFVERSGLQSANSISRALTASVFGAVCVLYVLPAIEELPAEAVGEIRRIKRLVRRPDAGTS